MSYRGHTFTVPADWDVVDLTKHPDTCVRYDRHAVYLGKPATQQDCPADVLGRTEALVLEPGAGSSEERVAENRTSHTYWATADDITVTASYGENRDEIKRILTGAGLPAAEATPAATSGTRAPGVSVQAVPADATSYQGKGFDRCAAPPTATMNAWKAASPYGAIGFYIGGVNAGCKDQASAEWVQTQYTNGWRFIPIYVGPQAEAGSGSCTGDCVPITDPVPEGAASARDAVAQAQNYGLPAGSVLYYNMEHYNSGREKVLAFLQSWTNTIHELGYRSGAYGSASSLATDLVAANSGGYVLPDVINFARWDEVATTEDRAIPADLWANHQRVKQYDGPTADDPNKETYGGITLDLDNDLLDVGQGGTQPPVQRDTALTYDGPATVSNGSPATLSATLKEKDAGTPVADREVTLTLGPTDALQTCKANTDAQGKASCTIDKVAQPLSAAATVPVKATFAGDEAYKASEATAEVKLQYVTGRAYGLSAHIPVLALPIGIAPTPDTGTVRAADAKTVAPACAAPINLLVLSADTLCAKVETKIGPSSATSTATVEDARIGLPGLPVVALSGVTATATGSCTATTGTADLKLTIAGTPVDVGDLPNYAIDLGPAAKLVINEQIKTANGITVNAAHLTAAGGVDVTIASAASDAYNCA
ncbi:choice-of-anchor P family protein [Streptomyces sp. Act143]|uniref:choice-of-anchor P family protein n=1 Tax=Streptomyces sp. Act143 TaxID=2200760 RepID=UPI00215AB66E|nr:choice-of-anchor P family protein [Streptomyces sp. Act143]